MLKSRVAGHWRCSVLGCNVECWDELWDSGEQGNQVGNLMPCRGGDTLLHLIVDLGVCAGVAKSNHFPGVAGTPRIFQLRIYQLSYSRRNVNENKQHLTVLVGGTFGRSRSLWNCIKSEDHPVGTVVTWLLSVVFLLRVGYPVCISAFPRLFAS